MKDTLSKVDNISRFEVIDEYGRVLVRYGITDCKLSIQDEGRTMKVFIASDLKAIKSPN